MRVTLIQGARQQQAGQHQGDGLLVGQAHGRQVARAVEAEAPLLLPERDALGGEKINIPIYRAAIYQ